MNFFSIGQFLEIAYFFRNFYSQLNSIPYNTMFSYPSIVCAKTALLITGLRNVADIKSCTNMNQLNLFLVIYFIWYSLKSLWFSGIFRGYKMEKLTRNVSDVWQLCWHLSWHQQFFHGVINVEMVKIITLSVLWKILITCERKKFSHQNMAKKCCLKYCLGFGIV